MQEKKNTTSKISLSAIFSMFGKTIRTLRLKSNLRL